MTEQLVPSSTFPLLSTTTYLDNAGACLYPPSQLTAVYAELTSAIHYNPHSNPENDAKIREARQRVLRFLNTNEQGL